MNQAKRATTFSALQVLIRHPAFLGLVGVLASLLTMGFDIIGADQQLYVPFMRKWANPSLYPNDFVFAGTNFHATLFVPVFGTILRLTRCDVVTLQTVGYLLVLFVFISAIAAIITRVAPWPAPLWGALLFCWPLQIPGTGDSLYEPNFHPHTFGIGLALWSLAQLLEGRIIVAAVLAVVTLLFHPLVGLAALVGGFLGCSAYGRRALARWTVAAGLLILVARLAWPAQHSSLPLRPVGWWIAAADADYLWFQTWSKSVFIVFVLWFMLAFATWRTRGDRALVCLARFGVAGVVLLGAAIVGMCLRSPLLVSLQLHRGFFAFQIVTLVFVARRLTEALVDEQLSWIGWLATSVIAVCHSALVELGTLGVGLAIAAARLPQKIQRWSRHAPVLALLVLLVAPPRPRYSLPAPDGWRALQDWARTHTAIDARFLVPQHYPDFRVFSERSSVLGTQDAAPAIFDEGLARAVAERQSVPHAYAERSCTALVTSATRFNAQFLVTEWPCNGLQLRQKLADFWIYQKPFE